MVTTAITALLRRSPRKRKASTSSPSLGREDWIAAARTELIAGGVNAVKIGRLAKRLRVTRGGFYWHFTSRADLLDELIQSWEISNTAPFERSLTSGSVRDGVREFVAIANLWLNEKEYSPAFDTAVRDWARISKAVAAAVRRVDERRIGVLHRIFLDLGFADPEALVRARVAYFHQVGYYTLAISQDRASRVALVPIYVQVLTGLPLNVVEEALKARTL
jgi:AcrR family transcriptional regulator